MNRAAERSASRPRLAAGDGAAIAASIMLGAALGVGAAPAHAEGGPDVRVGGALGFRWAPYLKHHDGSVPAIVEVRAAPRLGLNFRAVRAAAELEFRHDFLDPGRGPRFILREASFGLRWRGLSVDGGALLPRWGRMDYASPADALVAWDHEELFFAEPLPIPALQLGFTKDVIALQGIFVPAFVPSRYRTDAPSRWDIVRYLPSEQVVPTPLGDWTFTNHYDTFARGVPSGEEDKLARGFEGGARLELFLPGVDMQFSYFTGHDRLPTWSSFVVTNAGDQDGDGIPDQLETQEARLAVQPIHHRLHVPAFGIAGTAGPLVLKGEAAAYLTEDMRHEDPLIDDPYLHAAASAELVLPNLVGSFDLAIRAQWSMDEELRKDGDDALNQDRTDPVFTPADAEAGLTPDDYLKGGQATPAIRHPFRHAFTWNLNFGFTDTLNLDVRGFVDIGGNVLVMPRFAVTLQDHLELSIGALVLARTTPGSVFAPYADNHRLDFGLTWRL